MCSSSAGVRAKDAAPIVVIAVTVDALTLAFPLMVTDGAGTAAVAMIALDKATAIATRGSGKRDGLGPDERRGLVLGRVVAHEIGHFLLTTSPHQTDGLMRERFPENELIDVWSADFEVNRTMRAVALTTLANGFPSRVPAASLPTATAERGKNAD